MPNEPVRECRRQDVADNNPIEGLTDRELAGCQFQDKPLGRRFRTLFEQLAEGRDESIPMAYQDWANKGRVSISFE
jgi:hypothetical protein